MQHLLLCALNPAGVAPSSTLIGLDETVRFGPMPQAKALLADWLEAYRTAHRQLPPYLPRTSQAYAAALLKGSDDPYSATLLAWAGNERSLGEADYASVRVVWRGHSPLGDAFEDWASRLLLPMLQARKDAA